ncbi:MAG: HAD-IC family P-type ATPase, partial [Coriobacteriia bacterium]
SLPDGIAAVALVLAQERLRSNAADTVAYLLEEGIAVKIISGDNPRTVSRIAASAGVPGAEAPADARQLTDAHMLDAYMESASVFGRVMPEQKSAMVASLQRAGHTVCVCGDGVNDVLAIKQADLGVAMGSGASAARAVAQVVLLDDEFATVPLMMAEGRRVIANAERVANLFLTKSVWAMVLAVAIAVLGTEYPFLPRHITLVGSLAIGIPAFFLALGRNTRRYTPGFVRRVLRFAFPAGGVMAVAVLLVFLLSRSAGLSVADARTVSTLLLLAVSLSVIALLEWPLARTGVAIVATMATGGVLAFALPFTRAFFALSVLQPAWILAALAGSALTAGAIALLTAGVRRETRAVGR